MAGTKRTVRKSTDGKAPCANTRKILGKCDEGKNAPVEDKKRKIECTDRTDHDTSNKRSRNNRPFVFFSNAAESLNSTCKLSNFYACTVEHDGALYPSAEHAYQALKFEIGDREHFQVNGKLSGFEAMSYFYPEKANKAKNTANSKIKYWSKKGMVGILAKLAQGNPKKVGLVPMPMQKMNDKLKEFKRILLSKYRNPELNAILLATGDRYLLEFCRGAKKRELMGEDPEICGGLAEDLPDGRCHVYGQNLMGKLMMTVRSELRNVVNP